MGSRWQSCLVLLTLLGLSLFTAWLTKPKFLSGWDPVNFALAVEKYDIHASAPHPPGYIEWVALLKLLSTTLDVQTASTILNSVFEALTAFLVYLTLTEIFGADRRLSLGVALAWLLTPISWYYRSVAENYASGAFMTALVAYMALRSIKERNGRPLIAASFLAGLAGGFRVEVPVFSLSALIIALLTLLLSKRGWRLALIAAASYSVGILVWLIPQALLAGGLFEWVRLTLGMVGKGVERVSAANQPIIRVLASTALLISGNSFNVLSIIIVLLCVVKARRVKDLFLDVRFHALLWVILAFYAFSALVHLGKTGYLLPATPLLSIILTLCLIKSIGSGGRRFYATLLGLAIAINVGVFLFGPGRGELLCILSQSRGSLTSVLKAAAFKGELFTYLMGAPNTLRDIKSVDNALQTLFNLIKKDDISPRDTAIVVIETSFMALRWRQVMYYMPQFISVHVRQYHKQGNELGVTLLVGWNKHTVSINDPRLKEILKGINKCLVITPLRIPSGKLLATSDCIKFYLVKCEGSRLAEEVLSFLKVSHTASNA